MHTAILKRGFLEKSSYIADALVCMYAKCGVPLKAQGLLNGISVCDVFLGLLHSFQAMPNHARVMKPLFVLRKCRVRVLLQML